MNSGLDNGDLAGLSAFLAYLCLAAAGGMACLIWRYRRRFFMWRRLSTFDRADVILNVALAGLFGNAAWRQMKSTMAYATREWQASPFNIHNTLENLPWAIVFVAAFLWWACLYVFGARHYRLCWLLIVAAGLWLGFAIADHY